MVENFEDEFSVDTEVDAIIQSEGAEPTEAKPAAGKAKTTILTPDDFGSYLEIIKTPDIGETIVLDVKYVQDNEQTEGVNKTTGEKFTIGCKKKDGTVVRKDIITVEDKIYTISSWELFYKLFPGDTEFMKLAKANHSWEGLRVTITRKYNGRDAMQPEKDLMKLRDLPTMEAAVAYKKEVAEALKNNGLFDVKVEYVKK